MSKRKSRRNQKLYKMKGCSKTRKNYLGGKPTNINLAYPSNNVHSVPNPFLAYTGNGGAACSSTEFASNLAYPQNVNGANPIYPSAGPPSGGFNFLNSTNSQRGGSSRSLRVKGFMQGGSHRVGCKCSKCKKNFSGGAGNNGIPYPNGLVGSPWTPSVGGWPGVNGVDGDSNYYKLNTYPTDVQTSIINAGANRPFSIGGRKKQKGGALSNFLAQDLINVGRQFQFGLGSAYNAIAGYAAPTNPLPWKGQFPNVPTLTAIKASVI